MKNDYGLNNHHHRLHTHDGEPVVSREYQTSQARGRRGEEMVIKKKS